LIMMGSNIIQQKEKILSFLRLKGPSLPVQAAKAINTSLLFAGAFLSELYNEKKVRMSNMRVGGSPLYYLEGQVGMLESFIEHLNIREREAFLALKKEGVLEDEKQVPVVRVALRAIKDFAVPFRVRIEEDMKIFWRYFLLDEKEAISKVEKLLVPRVDIKKEEVEKKIEKIEDNKKKVIELEVMKKKIDEKKEDVRKEIKKEKKKIKSKESVFAKRVRDYLLAKDIEILESILESKKEFYAKIRIDMIFGKQEFFMVAKDKMVINEADIALGLQQAQTNRMPLLFVCNGKLNKKAEEHLKDWKSLIKIERIKI